LAVKGEGFLEGLWNLSRNRKRVQETLFGRY
jgi:hypothetical protein